VGVAATFVCSDKSPSRLSGMAECVTSPYAKWAWRAFSLLGVTAWCSLEEFARMMKGMPRGETAYLLLVSGRLYLTEPLTEAQRAAMTERQRRQAAMLAALREQGLR
ncbi:MAG: hypothetical protein RL235_253, partial [Chlamydiota bacterium]